jgi:hypothetical protein
MMGKAFPKENTPVKTPGYQFFYRILFHGFNSVPVKNGMSQTKLPKRPHTVTLKLLPGGRADDYLYFFNIINGKISA